MYDILNVFELGLYFQPRNLYNDQLLALTAAQLPTAQFWPNHIPLSLVVDKYFLMAGPTLKLLPFLHWWSIFSQYIAPTVLFHTKFLLLSHSLVHLVSIKTDQCYILVSYEQLAILLPTSNGIDLSTILTETYDVVDSWFRWWNLICFQSYRNSYMISIVTKIKITSL